MRSVGEHPSRAETWMMMMMRMPNSSSHHPRRSCDGALVSGNDWRLWPRRRAVCLVLPLSFLNVVGLVHLSSQAVDGRQRSRTERATSPSGGGRGGGLVIWRRVSDQIVILILPGSRIWYHDFCRQVDGDGGTAFAWADPVK